LYFEVPFNIVREITAETVLTGYTLGIFPMGDDDNENINWYYTNPRAIINLNPEGNGLHIPRSLSQLLKKNIFEVKIDNNFESVIHNCAKRENTWITDKIIDLYIKLHQLGYAHSVETYFKGKLTGGLYGVAYRSAFFGESMFHNYPNASKIAVVYLYNILRKNNFTLFDIQMMTSVFKILGAIHVPFNYYLLKLKRAMQTESRFAV